MDFFAMLLEGLLGRIVEKINFIHNPVIRGIIQIAVAAVICLGVIGLFFFVAYLVRKIRGN